MRPTPRPFLICHLSFAMLSLAACSPTTAAAPATSTAPADAPPITVTLGTTALTLEIADTPAKQELGLMYRRSMPADHGMLFIFDKPDTVSFWMKDTYIPLDIIYLDTAGKIVDIHDRKPLDETGMKPKSPALFVIELNEGQAAKFGLKIGDTVKLPDKYLKPASHPNDK